MRVGVKFCGGCNPRYDRGKALEAIIERLQGKDERRCQSAYGYGLRQVNCQNPKPFVHRFKCRANIRLRRIAHSDSNRTSRFEFVIAEEDAEYDYLLVIGGCTNCCASHSRYKAKNGKLSMWDESHIDRIIQEIKR